MKRLTFAAVLAAAVLGTTAAAPQDEWDRQVRAQIDAAGDKLQEQGYALKQRIYTGALANGATTTVELALDAGTAYAIMGACDTDCSDLDLVLMDPAGAKVAEDVLDDDIPVVAVEPTRSGTYRVTVAMAACSEEPCRYGLGVFGK
jgi:hypothetical protein